MRMCMRVVWVVVVVEGGKENAREVGRDSSKNTLGQASAVEIHRFDEILH